MIFVLFWVKTVWSVSFYKKKNAQQMCIFFLLKCQKCIFFFLKIVRSSFSFFQIHCLIPKNFGTVFENVGENESGAGAFFVSHLLCCLLLLKHALSSMMQVRGCFLWWCVRVGAWCTRARGRGCSAKFSEGGGVVRGFGGCSAELRAILNSSRFDLFRKWCVVC